MNTLPALLTPASTEVKLPNKPIRVMSIDLGTTNSMVAEIVWEPDKGAPSQAHCLVVKQETSEGDYFNVLTPSVVAIFGGKVIVGEGAKRLRAQALDNLHQNRNLFYECKNDMGIRKTYHQAPAGFRSAAEIGGNVLKYLYAAARDANELPLERTVVTVPASFQAAQRADTLKAAELAGLKVKGGDLLDEPVAAFLDYLFLHGAELLPELKTPKNLLVFDFGGGTCDVAVFRLHLGRSAGPLLIEPLAVSRYHRLGGGDIDLAIIYEVLLPQICEQNHLSPGDLGFEDKKRFITPKYLGVAEALKISLCTEIAHLIQFNHYDDGDRNEIRARLAGAYPCPFRGGSLILQSPSLTAAEFEKLLEPFLERDMLFARETEYRMTQSIFAPLQDAIDRSGVTTGQVDLCLMVGGSSLIPQVNRAVKDFMSQAQLLTYHDRESIQTAVARGAAYHALSLAIFGKGLVQPICHDRIAIRSQGGLVTLIPKGVTLPYPPDGGFANCRSLTVPETSFLREVELRVEIVAGEGKQERPLFSRKWDIPPPVNRGDTLSLKFRYDENQTFGFEMKLAGNDEATPLSETIENPLTNVVNPLKEKIEIEELEEQLRTGQIPANLLIEKTVLLAEKCSQIGQQEKAIECLRKALLQKNRPDAEILNQMANNYKELGDHQRAEKIYIEAALASPWSGPWFNLALAQKGQGRLEEAVESVEKAMSRDRLPPYLVLRAQLAESQNNKEYRDNFLNEALRSFSPIPYLSDWQLGWFLTAALMAGDSHKAQEAEAERKRRATEGGQAPLGGVLPGKQAGLEKV